MHALSVESLIATAQAFGADRVPGYSGAEASLTRGISADTVTAPIGEIEQIREALLRGEDPLGEAFCDLRSPEERRPLGATYTPRPIVEAMVQWSTRHVPSRVVDPGLGSARFLIAAGHVFPDAELVGVEVDPLSALIARANLSAVGFANRATVHLADYRTMPLARIRGRTLFIGNPPYVRHHGIGAQWKDWLSRTARAMDLKASQLAGLHVHFFVATALHVSRGDYGSFVTAAEWLDVNYGRTVRSLFAERLGGERVDIIEPGAMPFSDADATAAVSSFEVGSEAKGVRFRRVASLGEIAPLGGGRAVKRAQLVATERWSEHSRPARTRPDGHVELGTLCRVHRGQVTGLNRAWIAGAETSELPETVLFPAITRAKELIAAGSSLVELRGLRSIVDLPADLNVLSTEERERVGRFLEWAKEQGAHETYVARHRKPWWRVGLKRPAPILATYMARRAPVFVRNRAGARHINIAHGIYPRETLTEKQLDGLAAYLNSATSVHEGRTYARGLTKFEPKEMERLWIPAPNSLGAYS